MTPSEARERLLGVLLDLAWCQWSSLGVAGARMCDRVIVDPEALLLATLEVARWDARLFDEALDWVAVNAGALDMARSRRLARRATAEQQRLLAVVADIAIESGARSSFRRIGSAGLLAQEAPEPYAVRPLFRSQQDPAADWTAEDERFERAGFARAKLHLRGMSSPAPADVPACLRMRARALVGIGARAEVLTYLWTHEWSHGRLIAERAAYNQATVADYLSDLADARLAERRTDGRRTLYRLARGLRAAGGDASPVYVDWVRGWPALVALLAALAADAASDDAIWLRLAQTLDEQRAGLGTEGIEVHVPDLHGWARSGPETLIEVLDAVVRAVQELAR